jgi:hypothetical protein
MFEKEKRRSGGQPPRRRKQEIQVQDRTIGQDQTGSCGEARRLMWFEWLKWDLKWDLAA